MSREMYIQFQKHICKISTYCNNMQEHSDIIFDSINSLLNTKIELNQYTSINISFIVNTIEKQISIILMDDYTISSSALHIVNKKISFDSNCISIKSILRTIFEYDNVENTILSIFTDYYISRGYDNSDVKEFNIYKVICNVFENDKKYRKIINLNVINNIGVIIYNNKTIIGFIERDHSYSTYIIKMYNKHVTTFTYTPTNYDVEMILKTFGYDNLHFDIFWK